MIGVATGGEYGREQIAFVLEQDTTASGYECAGAESGREQAAAGAEQRRAGKLLGLPPGPAFEGPSNALATRAFMRKFQLISVAMTTIASNTEM